MVMNTNISVTMPVRMVRAMDEQKPADMSRAEYIRRCVRSDYKNQFDVTALDEETELGELAETEA